MKRSCSELNRAACRACLLSQLAAVPAFAQGGGEPGLDGYPASPARIAMRVDRLRANPNADALLPYGSPDSIPIGKSLAVTEEARHGPRPNECGIALGSPDPAISVGQFPDPEYVHTLSKGEIRSLESEVTGQAKETVGLTQILLGGVEARTSEAQARSGTRCVVVDGVMLIPMRTIKVYLPREYPEGSCNYKAVKRHEDKHVAIARRLLVDYTPRFLDAVHDLRLESHGFAAWVDDETASNERIASEVQPAVQAVLDAMHAGMNSANRALDAADTERALGECPFW